MHQVSGDASCSVIMIKDVIRLTVALSWVIYDRRCGETESD